ncbi:hypothetical protein [Brooklawnia propionicigenes]|uniref:hypothetical protein n=1 Tax=Brooklawnia propionicigenes TaxID=3041175 RepID=UPI002572D209|nr:hypothetical protein [Brooklawnia sp. SH051]
MSGRRFLRQQHSWLAPLVVVVAVMIGSTAVYLRTNYFYYWDDSASAFLPTWYAVGQDLWSGTWPTMRPDIWTGGNWSAEAQFGLWNPVNLVMMMVVAKLPDLAVAAFVVKAFWQVMLAMGAFLLAREYGAKEWLAAAVAIALPFAGFTLYFDTATWIASLLATVWTAWFWWAARRVLNGRFNPFVGFVFGYLLITNGSPYGALSAVIVLIGLAFEALLYRQYRALWKLVLMGGLVGACALVAYLPLVLSSGVGWRDSQGIINNGVLSPDTLMLMATSTSSMLPNIVWSYQGTSVPSLYSAWFLLPILPWLSWSTFRLKAKQMGGLWLVFGIYLLLVLGPSQIWLFRWPVRLLEYLWLALFVIIAVVLSEGVRTSAWKLRASGSMLIAVVGTIIALLMRHDLLQRHLVALIVQVTLIGLMVVVMLKLERLLPAVMIGGTLLTLGLQITWVPFNADLTQWHAPSSSAIRADYRENVRGPVLQIAEMDLIPPDTLDEAGRWLLFGTTPAASGVESTASYTGLGFNEFMEALCLKYQGSTCPAALDTAFSPVADAGGVLLVDALGMNTVVVQNELVPEVSRFELPAGWRMTESNEWVTLFARESPMEWPDSRLSVTDGVSVTSSAPATYTSEALTVSTAGASGSLTFARLAWPGYTATVNGTEIPVITNSVGLVRLDLPAGLVDAELSLNYTVPGYRVAVPVLVVAVLGAVLQGIVVARGSRPRRVEASG